MDSGFVRTNFPSVTGDWILFENAGGTQAPVSVENRMTEFFRRANVQPGYNYPHSLEATDILQEAHQFVADWINAPSPEQIIFGPSATAINRLMAVALSHYWKEGDEIIVTVSDHEANVNPWVYLEKFGLQVKFWPINRDTFALELDDLKSLLSGRTVLVAFPHVSNLLGFENDVTSITRVAHEAGAWVYVDGVAGTPHKPVDVSAWDADFFVFSTYKTFGPHMAALYGKRQILLQLESPNHFFLPNQLPLKFELGTPNLEGAAALLGVKDYFVALYEHHFGAFPEDPREGFLAAMDLIAEYETELAWYLIDGLQRIPHVKIVGNTDPASGNRRVPVVSFIHEEKSAEEISVELAERNIAIGHGHFYAYRLVEYLGLLQRGGVARASLVHYNTREEIDRFLTALAANAL